VKRDLSFILLLCAVCVCLIAQTTPCFADKRVALVIGNSKYENTPALANPANDATDVAQALTAIGFQVTLKLDAEKRQMDQATAQFAREASNADAVLFYYAGHGMQFQGRNFLMPVDAELQDEISLRYEMTAIDDVKAALEQSSGVKIMVLDACRSNPLAAKLVRSISVATRDVPNVQGYARPERTRGMIIVYATQADDVANDGVGRNSPFSTAFLKEIKEPGIEIGTMFRRIGGDVYQATNGQQSPELSISLVSEYYLNQAETDQAVWARIRARADADAIREFLGRHPESFYAPDARARLELLDRETREKADRLTEKQKQVASAMEAEHAQEQELAAKRAAAEAGISPVPAPVAPEVEAVRAQLAKPTAARADKDAEVQADGLAAAQRLEKERRAQNELARPQAGRETTPQPRTEVAAGQRTPDQACKRDEGQLARLRFDPSLEQVEKFARELACEDLRPQVQRLIESLGDNALATTQSQLVASAPQSKAAALTPDQACKRDEGQLARLRLHPSLEQVEKFAQELGCEDLRPQVQRLMESLGDRPVVATQPQLVASAPRSMGVADTPIAATQQNVDKRVLGQAGAQPPDNSEACKHDSEELVRIRAYPNRELALRFARDLKCEDLRAQAARLLESISN
jgi:uncharacterized caspase-like protein